MIKDRKSIHGYGFQTISYEGIDNEISSVIFGNGSVRVSTTYSPEANVVGVSLASAPENREIGCYFIVDGVPKDPNEPLDWVTKNAKFQMLFDNPASIDVVVSRLLEAKRRLLHPEYKDVE